MHEKDIWPCWQDDGNKINDKRLSSRDIGEKRTRYDGNDTNNNKNDTTNNKDHNINNNNDDSDGKWYK